MDGGWGWKPYVSAAERRRKALRTMESLRKRGHAASGVVIEGRTIAKTFWGKAWCDKSGTIQRLLPIACRAGEPMCAMDR